MVNSKAATMEDVHRWLQDEVFKVLDDQNVYKVIRTGEYGGDTKLIKLKQRQNVRKECNQTDPRVDLQHEGKRRSIHVSQIVWMQESRCPIPVGWEIHHINEDPQDNRFDNLMCLHPSDHRKIHAVHEWWAQDDEEEPF